MQLYTDVIYLNKNTRDEESPYVTIATEMNCIVILLLLCRELQYIDYSFVMSCTD